METKKLTVKDCATELNVDAQTVRRWIKAGTLKAEKVPKGKQHTYLIDEEELKKVQKEINA